MNAKKQGGHLLWSSVTERCDLMTCFSLPCEDMYTTTSFLAKNTNVRIFVHCFDRKDSSGRSIKSDAIHVYIDKG